MKIFDGTNNFGIWQCKVLDILIQHDLNITLEAKPDDMSKNDWAKLKRQVCDIIRLCLAKTISTLYEGDFSKRVVGQTREQVHDQEC